MIIVDCKSPLSQKIIEQQLKEFEDKFKDKQYIITDKAELQGDNIINISDVPPPFNIQQILSKISISDTPSQQENKTPNLDTASLQQTLKKDQEIEECNCKDEVMKLKQEIFNLIEENSKNLKKELEKVLEKS